MVQARGAGGELLGDAAGGGQRLLHLALARGPEGRLLRAVPVQARLAAVGRPRQRDVVPRAVRPARTPPCRSSRQQSAQACHSGTSILDAIFLPIPSQSRRSAPDHSAPKSSPLRRQQGCHLTANVLPIQAHRGHAHQPTASSLLQQQQGCQAAANVLLSQVHRG